MHKFYNFIWFIWVYMPTYQFLNKIEHCAISLRGQLVDALYLCLFANIA